MSLHALAGHMAAKGRGSDSMLVHMTPEEVQSLQVLALKSGGTLTINPDTGLPEANFLKKMLPMIAGAALNFFAPGLGTAVGGMFGLGAAAGTGIAVGGISALATGSLSRGLMAGLGAYGGASLAGGLQNLGATAVAPEALAAANASADPIMSLTAAKDAATAAGIAPAAGAEAAKQGLAMAANNPKSFMTAMGGPAKALGAAYAAATPVLAGDMVPTTTQMPDSANTKAYIRPKRFDPYTQQMVSYDPILASEFGSRRLSDFTSGDGTPGSASGLMGLDSRRPAGMASGGIVALAAGGPSSIEDLYQTYAGRGSDPGGLQYWQQQFGDKIDPGEIDIFKSAVAEARAQGTEPTDVTQSQANTMVQDMYRNVLNRDAEQSGLNYWSDMIQSTNDPSRIYKDFLASAQAGSEIGNFGLGFDQATTPFQGYRSADTGSNADEWVRNVLKREVTDADRNQQWYKDMAGVTTAQEAKDAYSDFLKSTGAKTDLNWMAASQLNPLLRPRTTPQTSAPAGTTNPYGNATNPGDLTFNPDGSTTVQPNIPGRPYGGFSGMQEVKDAYTAGGGSLGYTPYAPATLREFQERYTNTGGSKQAYDYLMNRGEADVRRPVTKTGELMLPYADIMGMRRQVPAGARAPVVEEKEVVAAPVVEQAANGGVMRMALGGLGALAGGGSTSQYNLGGYSDGGRLLRGPGDGVSDSIPATIGDKQPARLADGEFVVPARIVSELGNGSTEAGARKLYAMMDRVQKARGKTTGKNRVAANTRSEKFLPA